MRRSTVEIQEANQREAGLIRPVEDGRDRACRPWHRGLEPQFDDSSAYQRPAPERAPEPHSPHRRPWLYCGPPSQRGLRRLKLLRTASLDDFLARRF